MHLDARKDESSARLFAVADKGERLVINSQGLKDVGVPEIEHMAVGPNNMQLAEDGKLPAVQANILQRDPENPNHWRIVKGVGYATVKGLPSHPDGLVRGVTEFEVHQV